MVTEPKTALDRAAEAAMIQRRKLAGLSADAAEIAASQAFAEEAGDDVEATAQARRYDAVQKKIAAETATLAILADRETHLRAGIAAQREQRERARMVELAKGDSTRVTAVEKANAKVAKLAGQLLLAAQERAAVEQEHGGAIQTLRLKATQFEITGLKPNPLMSLMDIPVEKAHGLTVGHILRAVTGTPGKASPMARSGRIGRLLGKVKLA